MVEEGAPKISIVIPTMNRGDFLLHCLESIRGQAFENFEVIIQDNQSTDETQSLCEEYALSDRRFRYYREADTGQSDALNRGLSRSQGAYWTWICSDDYYNNPQALGDLCKAFESLRDAGLETVGVYGLAQMIDSQTGVISQYLQKQSPLRREDFWTCWPLAQPSILLLAERVREVGAINANLDLGMDLDLFIRMLGDGREFAFVNTSVVTIARHEESKSSKFELETALQALTIVRYYFGSLGDVRTSQYWRSYHQVSLDEGLKRFFAFFLIEYPIKHSRLRRELAAAFRNSKGFENVRASSDFLSRLLIAISYVFVRKAFREQAPAQRELYLPGRKRS